MKTYFRKNLSTAVFLGLLIFIRTTFANEYVVPSGSMEPTIAVGDRIFVNRIAYDLKLPFTNLILKNIHDPKRGSIVVFESPIKPGLVLVKRLIAIPGDEVEIKNGFVFLNGKATAEPLPDQIDYHEVIGMHDHLVQRIPELYHPDYFHFRVPEGHFFMMGDNRDNSADGRVFGFVSRDLLIGEATRVIFSMNIDQPLNKIVAWQRFLKALI